MTLTKHLYELDEVVSALQICLRNGWPRGLFWLWELVASQEEELAHVTLTDAWLYWGGGYDPHSLKETEWIRRYLRIAAAIQNTGSLQALRLLITETNRPSLTPLASRKGKERRRIRSAAFVASLEGEQLSPKEAANFWISYDSACRQGSRKDALWLLQAAQHRLSADAIWSAITIAVRGSAITKEAIALLKEGSGFLYQVAATLILCTSTATREQGMLAIKQLTYRVQQEQWISWSAAIGRHARIYPIPPEAIHKETTRGQIARKYTNIGDIRDPAVVEGCQFWRSAMEEFGITQDAETGAIIFPDDDTLEGFYNRYFPDDIPDEWSKVDQEKSHGRGCQETAGEPIRIPQMSLSALAWKHGIHVRA